MKHGETIPPNDHPQSEENLPNLKVFDFHPQPYVETSDTPFLAGSSISLSQVVPISSQIESARHKD